MFDFFRPKPLQTAGRCGSCSYFHNDPTYLEREIPGLTSMSSAHASVRTDDGVCSRHDRYFSARASCKEFIPIVPVSAANCRMATVPETN